MPKISYKPLANQFCLQFCLRALWRGSATTQREPANGPATGTRSRTLRAAMLAAALTLTACAPIVAIRGNLPNDLSVIDTLRPGTATKADVQRALGNPLQSGAFDPNKWIYFRQQTQRYAFFDPVIIQHEVVVFLFAPSGDLQNVQRLNEGDINNVGVDRRETFVPRQDVNVLNQIINNAGAVSSGP